MNDFELNSKLKALQAPERDTDYWEMFPRRVLDRARAMPAQRSRRGCLPRLAWGRGIAFAVLVIGFCLGPSRGFSEKTLLYAVQSAKSYQEVLVQLPERARALMQIEHGLSPLIEEQP